MQLSSFGWAVCLVSGIATKKTIAFPKSFTIFWGGHIRPSYFQTNVFSKFSFTNCLGYGFVLIFSRTWDFNIML